MAAKSALSPFQVVKNASMATSVTSQVTVVTNTDNIVYVARWTGTPTGTFSVNTSSDYVPAPGGTGAPVNAGTWQALPLSASVSAVGSADDARIELSQLPDHYVQLVYTAVSGSGTLNVYVSGKGT